MMRLVPYGGYSLLPQLYECFPEMGVEALPHVFFHKFSYQLGGGPVLFGDTLLKQSGDPLSHPSCASCCCGVEYLILVTLLPEENGELLVLCVDKIKSLFGYNGSFPFSHTNDPFPSVSKLTEGHFHSRNGRPTERNRCSQTGSNRSPAWAWQPVSSEPKTITTEEALHNTFSFLLRLIDGILSTDYCDVFKLFLLIFLGWVGVVVSRKLIASRVI